MIRYREIHTDNFGHPFDGVRRGGDWAAAIYPRRTMRTDQIMQPHDDMYGNKKMHSNNVGAEKTASQKIDAKIGELDDWRGETLAFIRNLIKEVDPEVIEDWKWRGVPTWYRGGMICTGETYKNKVKMTFAKGASLDDPSSLFNASLNGKVRRAIDIYQNDKIDTAALKLLIQRAIAENLSR